MQQLCNGIASCNPGRRKMKSLAGRKGEVNSLHINLLGYELLGPNPLQEAKQKQLSVGFFPTDTAVSDFPFCLNSPCQHPPAMLNTPVF